MTFLVVTFFILLIVALVVAVNRRSGPVIYDDFDDEVTHTTVTTTTVTEQPAPLIATVGVINAFQEAGSVQWYVIDPVDKEKTAVNANDDYYRDAGGKVWDLQ
jgi:glucose dehydrogenase